jgi:hypothetical protein
MRLQSAVRSPFEDRADVLCWLRVLRPVTHAHVVPSLTQTTQQTAPKLSASTSKDAAPLDQRPPGHYRNLRKAL